MAFWYSVRLSRRKVSVRPGLGCDRGRPVERGLQIRHQRLVGRLVRPRAAGAAASCGRAASAPPFPRPPRSRPRAPHPACRARVPPSWPCRCGSRRNIDRGWPAAEQQRPAAGRLTATAAHGRNCPIRITPPSRQRSKSGDRHGSLENFQSSKVKVAKWKAEGRSSKPEARSLKQAEARRSDIKVGPFRRCPQGIFCRYNSPVPTGPRFVFEPFELDSARRRLTASGEPVAISERQLDVLLLLVARAGQIISKDDLLQAGWKDVAVGDNSLEQAISSLRRLLGAPSERRRRASKPFRGADTASAPA